MPTMHRLQMRLRHERNLARWAGDVAAGALDRDILHVGRRRLAMATARAWRADTAAARDGEISVDEFCGRKK
jgi:hypothetical protein